MTFCVLIASHTQKMIEAIDAFIWVVRWLLHFGFAKNIIFHTHTKKLNTPHFRKL
jgi:hypothetical protein